MPRWDASLIELIRERNDIVDVISQYVTLKRAGSNYKGLSPFKKEKTPSFYVTPSKQIWYCFSTGQGGDVFKFLQNYLGLDFPSAVRMLAERAGVGLPETGQPHESDSQHTGENHLKEQLINLHERLTTHWHTLLMRSDQAEDARAYLKSRGITSSVAREFRIGFAPPGWQNLHQWAKEEGFDELLLLSAGLLVKKENAKPEDAYDRFRNRIIIPITSESGHVVAFSGRSLQKNDPREPKYINSPETPIFEKSRILLGLELHRRELLESRQAIIVEGPFDLVACHIAGVKNVVASQGTALTERHVRTLKRYVDEILLCYDSDEAGQTATRRAAIQCFSQGLPVRVLKLTSPDGAKEDPDSFIRQHGAESFISLAGSAPDFWQFYFQILINKHPPTSERGRYTLRREIFEVASHMTDAAEIDRVLQRLAAHVGSDTRILQTELNEWKKKNITNHLETTYSNPISPSQTELQPHPVVAELLYLCLNDPDKYIPLLQSEMPREWLFGLVGQDLLTDLLESYGTDNWEGTSDYISSKAENLQPILYKIFISHTKPPPISHILSHLEKKYLQQKLKSLENQLISPECDQKKLLIEILDIKTKLHKLTCFTEEFPEQPQQSTNNNDKIFFQKTDNFKNHP